MSIDVEEVCFCTRRHEHVWPGGRMPSPASLVPAEATVSIDAEALRQAYDTVTLDWSPGEGGFFSMLAAEYARLVPAEDECECGEPKSAGIHDPVRTWVRDPNKLHAFRPRVPAEDEGRPTDADMRRLLQAAHDEGAQYARRTADEGRLRVAQQLRDEAAIMAWPDQETAERLAAEDEGRLREAHKAWHPDCSGGCEIMRFVGSLAATPEPRPYQHGSEARMAARMAAADEGRLRTAQKLRDEAAIMAWPDQETAERLAAEDEGRLRGTSRWTLDDYRAEAERRGITWWDDGWTKADFRAALAATPETTP